jgi:hypothetical protein
MPAPTNWGRNVPVLSARSPEPGVVAYWAGDGGGPVARIDRPDGTTGDFWGFPDLAQQGWQHGLNCAWGDDGLLYAMPGFGGGCVLRVFNKQGVLVRAELRGDPADRRGGVPVPVTVVRTVTVERLVERLAVPPAMTVGDTADPDPFVVYVLWERPANPDQYPPAQIAKVMTRLADVYRPVRRLAFTTVRPNHQPTWYGTCYAGANLGWSATPQAVDGAGGIAFAVWTDGNGRGESEGVYVNLDPRHTDPDTVHLLLGHEIAHGFGWQHSHSPAGDFRDNFALIQEGVLQALKLRPAK